MKKLISIIVVLILVATMCTAFADTIDVSALKDDEIVSLSKMCQEEMVKRGLNKVATIPNGMYAVGKDIPEGSYDAVVTVPKESEQYSAKEICVIDSIESQNPLAGTRVKVNPDCDAVEEIHLTVSAGNVIWVDGTGTVELRISTGIVFE